jgi:bacteriochlorophyll 4-vinyl reductase
MSTNQRWVENSIMALALTSTETTVGKNGYRAVLQLAGLERYLDNLPAANNRLETPGEDFAALLKSLFNMYGENSARGLFRRWGTTFGLQGVKRRHSALLLKPLLLLLPLQRRTRTVLDALVSEANAARGATLHTLIERQGFYQIEFRDCLYCDGLHPTAPICFSIVGILEAVLKWGVNREFDVQEVQCAARGDAACVFRINKRPLDV